jgi:hypothetical protein
LEDFYEDVWEMVYETLKEVNSELSMEDMDHISKPKNLLTLDQAKKFNGVIRMKVRNQYQLTIPKNHILGFGDLYGYVYFLTDFIEARLKA